MVKLVGLQDEWRKMKASKKSTEATANVEKTIDEKDNEEKTKQEEVKDEDYL